MKKKSIGRLTSVLYRQSHIYINYALKDLNLTSSECTFMAELYYNEGINQEELSSLLLIDKAAIARTVKSLEQKDLVIREKDKNDKRANKVFTTDKGKSYKERIYSTLRGWTKLLTDSIDEKTIQIVISSLEHMSEKAGNINYEKLFANGGDISERNK